MKEHDLYSKVMNILLYLSIIGVSIGVIVYYVNSQFSKPVFLISLGLLTFSPFIGIILLAYYYLKKKDYKTFLNILIVMLIALINLINLWMKK